MKIRSLAPGLVLAAMLSGPATAAVYVGNWDPPFGSPFAADLGWRGTADYFVPDFCELAGTGSVDNATACSGGAVVTSAKVEFYDTDVPGTPIQTMIFTPASLSVATLYYLAGQLDQLDTSFSNFLPADTPLSAYGVDVAHTTFALQFTSSGPRLHFETCVPGFDCVSGANDATAFPPDFTITRVPEPASIALAGFALAGLAAVRRRRGNAAAAA